MKTRRIAICLLLASVVISILMLHPAKASAASGQCGADLYYSFSSSGTLTISGTGDFYKKSSVSAPYNAYWDFNSQIKKVVIKEGVTKLPAGLFASCENLKTVTLPDSVVSIGSRAFSGCKSLTKINFPKDLNYIGESAFVDCALTEAVLPEGVTVIREAAFYNCEKLQTVSFAGKLTEIDDRAFYSCDTLTTVAFSGGFSGMIGEESFGYCVNLQNIEFPEGITSIKEHAFVQCVKLESITLPESLESLWGGAFRECDSLTTVTIPRAVDYMSGDVFVFSENLQGVTMYAETVAAISKRQFGGCDNLRYVHVIGDAPTPKVNNIFSIHNADEDFVVYYDPETSGWQEPTWQAYWLEPWGGLDENAPRTGSCGENAVWTLENGVLTISGTGPLADYKASKKADEVPAWFRWRETIQTVVIEEGITGIGDWAFYGCSSLKRMTVPGSVTSFSACGCKALRVVQFLGDAPEFTGTAFSDVTATVYYPADNPTWTEAVLQQYGGTITWVAYAPGEPIGTLGDTSGDGVVDTYDATLILQYDVGMIAGDTIRLDLADVSGDGIVDTYDATLILQYDVGMITEFPGA